MTTKQQYWKHREKIRAYNREWYKQNSESQKIKQNVYRRQNPEYWKQIKIQAGLKRPARNWAEKNKVKIFAVKGNYCKNCDSVESIELHHNRYVNEIDAIDVYCRPCHTKLHVDMR